MEEELIMQLTKHHGLENDFLVALLDEEPHNLSELAARICNRRTGIGADGLLLGLLDHLARCFPSLILRTPCCGLRWLRCDLVEAFHQQTLRFSHSL